MLITNPNAQHSLNRHLFIADNLNLLRRLDNESVDLICIDPPFAKNQTFVGSIRPPLSQDERESELQTLRGWDISNASEAAKAGIEWPDGENSAKFADIWRWENDVHEDWVTRIEADYPALAKVIDATRTAHSEGMAAYQAYMAIRIIEMQRVLKSTGSIYLHCDPTASHYLKAAMDAIFGTGNFRSEITWQRTSSHNDSKRFGQVRDIILFYSKTNKRVWNPVYVPHDETYVSDFYRYEDDRGRYRLDHIIRTASMGPRPNLAYEYQGYTPEWGWRMVRNKLEALDLEGLLVWSKSGRPYRKRYLSPGRNATNLWDDIPNLSGQSAERTGYPTQKPVALAERIILASSNPGDMVLDCFAGCAYVPVAAERTGRQWIACDISPRALTVLKRQFAKFRYAVDGAQNSPEPALITDANIITRAPHELPQRTDSDPTPAQDIKPLPLRRFKTGAPIIPESEMKAILLEELGYNCWGCGFAPRDGKGNTTKDQRYFQLDHREPRYSKGSNDLPNRAILCQPCNLDKGHRLNLQELRNLNLSHNRIIGSLVDLDQANNVAIQHLADWIRNAPH